MPSSTERFVCPSCGVQVQRGVIRCRDCGAFLDQGAVESSARKSWPGLPEDASQRAAEAAAAARKVGDSGRTEEDLQHDMSFADSLFKQTEERVRSVSDRGKEEDFLLDVTPISEERHVPTLKKPPAQKESRSAPASDVQPLATPPAAKPAAPPAPASKPVVAESPAPTAAPPAAAPASSQPLPTAYPNDPYAGYPLVDYSGAGYQQGAAPGYPQGYPQQQYPSGEYPPANYPGYAPQYGYADYSAAGYAPGTYPQQQYDPNYAAQQYGYAYDPATGQYYDPATGQYVVDPSQQYADPTLQYSLAPLDGDVATELPAELPTELPQDLDPISAVTEADAALPAEAAATDNPAEPAAEAAPGDQPAEVKPSEEAPVKSHSEETAGDILLAAALEEESTRGGPGAGKKSGRGKPGSLKGGEGLVVFCPYGHRVQVQPKFRGKAGRCPLCKSTFFVPEDLEVPEPVQVIVPETIASLDSRVWLDDIRLHRVNPAKVKFTPGSLSEDYDTVDLGMNADGILVTVLFKAGGLFRNMQEPKKKPITRKAVREHLAAGKALDQIPAPQQFLVKSDALTQLRMLQPVKAGEESLFSGVPVFGEGRIVVRIPPPEAAEQRWCLSFSLSQFREFCRRLIEFFGLADFGNSSGIPLEDEMSDVLCSFSGNPLQVLEHVEYYKADSTFTLQVVGRKCQGCGAIVDESVREEHKIGGKQDGSVAKSKCPKCQQKFGEIKLYRVKPSDVPVETTSVSSTADAALESPLPGVDEAPTLTDAATAESPAVTSE